MAANSIIEACMQLWLQVVCIVGLDQVFPTFLPSRTTWKPCIVNLYHLLLKN